jgi:aryl-alcohol dehydrogenase-like predicted oxidoreductase
MTKKTSNALIPQTKIGKTTLSVPSLSVGTLTWGDSWNWIYYGTKGYTQDDAKKAFETCIASGFTFFDTAELYCFGRSEYMLGTFLRETNADVTISTKFFPYPWRRNTKELRKSLHGSLKRLGRDYIDIYHMHAVIGSVPIEDWMNAMADVYEEGLIRAIGVSNYNVEQLTLAHQTLAKRGIPLACNQMEYSLLRRDIEKNAMMEACQKLGVTLTAYMPLATGLLTGKYKGEDMKPGGFNRFSKRMKRENIIKIQPFIDLMREIGKSHNGKTPSQVAVNWVFQKGTLPVVGVRNAKQAQELSGMLDWKLTDSEMKRLDEESLKYQC